MNRETSDLELLILELAGRRLGLNIRDVRAVHHAVMIVPLPEVEGIVEGVIDVHGLLVPVFDVRARLGLAAKPVTASDKLVVVRAEPRDVAIRVEAALGVATVAAAELETDRAQVTHFAGLARARDGLVIIYDLAKFLNADEAIRVEAAVSEHAG